MISTFFYWPETNFGFRHHSIHRRAMFVVATLSRLLGCVLIRRRYSRLAVKLSPKIIAFPFSTRKRKSGSCEFARWRRRTRAGTCVRSIQVSGGACVCCDAVNHNMPISLHKIQWSHKWDISTLLVSFNSWNLLGFSTLTSVSFTLSVAGYSRRSDQPWYHCSRVWKRDIDLQSNWITR